MRKSMELLTRWRRRPPKRKLVATTWFGLRHYLRWHHPKASLYLVLLSRPPRAWKPALPESPSDWKPPPLLSMRSSKRPSRPLPHYMHRQWNEREWNPWMDCDWLDALKQELGGFAHEFKPCLIADSEPPHGLSFPFVKASMPQWALAAC